jgi:Tfp pilus assembly protein PilV
MMQQLPRYGMPVHQLGVTLLPALVTVALLTIIITWVDIPQQMQKQHQNQAIAHTNNIVQLLAANLKHYDEHNQWPTNLEADLAPYLPIQPADEVFAGVTITTTARDQAEVIINAEKHAIAIARQLARQFGEINVDIIDATGQSASHGDRVKVELQAYKNGSSYYLAVDEGTDDFGGNTHGAASKATDYVSLTTDINYQNGQIQFDNIHSGDRMYATFDTWIGGGTGADALYFYWAATARPHWRRR